MSLRLGILLLVPVLPIPLLAESCGSEDPPPEDCERIEAPADGVRRVVVSHPYTASGGAAKVFEVLELSASGALTQTGSTFELGRSTYGPIHFTPDGRIGLTVQEDGTLGAFRFEGSGEATVVHAAFGGSFYAGGLLMDPGGQRAYVLDPNWRENGGGIYAVHIYCDGQLEDEGLLAPARLAYAGDWIPGHSGEALIAARDLLQSPVGDDAHRVRLGEDVALTSGTDVFGDDDAIVSALEITLDGRYALIGDNNLFSGTGNRVGVMDLQATLPVQVLDPVEDPVSLVASPFHNAVLVVSGFGDALFRYRYMPGADAPLALEGELSYVGGRPQLPSHAHGIARGSLAGLVLVAENTAIRTVRFESDGRITDLGKLSFGSGYTAIVGALGVTP